MSKVIEFPSHSEPPEGPAATVRELKRLKRLSIIGVRVPRQLDLWLQGEADTRGFSKSTMAAVYILERARQEISQRRLQKEMGKAA